MPHGPGRPTPLRIAALPPFVLSAAIAIALQAAGAPPAIGGDAVFGSEVVSNICRGAADNDMAAYYQCLDAERDQERKTVAAATDRALRTARGSSFTQSFAPAIARAEDNWISWMNTECALEGLIDGGSTTAPWADRCELRMMKERLATLASLQSTLEKLINSPVGRRGASRGTP